VRTGHDHTWFVLNQRVIKREFALSGSEQNPDLTNKDLRQLAERALSKSTPGPVEAFKEHGADFVVERRLRDLVRGMNALSGDELIDADRLEREMVARDREIANPFSKDMQVVAIHGARRYRGDRLSA